MDNKSQDTKLQAPTAKTAASLPDYELGDDRRSIQAGDRVLLIVEHDIRFARIVLDMARARDFKELSPPAAELD